MTNTQTWILLYVWSGVLVVWAAGLICWAVWVVRKRIELRSALKDEQEAGDVR